MPGSDYVKLWDDFWTSSIADTPPHTRLLFLAMCSMANERGELKSTVSGLARKAVLSEEDVVAGLEILTSPDPLSTTDREEGRRVVSLGPNAWRIVTFEDHRDRQSAEDRREYWRQKKAEQRAKGGSSSAAGPTEPKFVPPTLQEATAYFIEHGSTPAAAKNFFDHFTNCKWRLASGRGKLMKDWRLAANNWISEKFVKKGGKASNGRREISQADLDEADRMVARARNGEPLFGQEVD